MDNINVLISILDRMEESIALLKREQQRQEDLTGALEEQVALLRKNIVVLCRKIS